MYDQIIRFLETNSSNEPQLGHVDRVLGTQEKTGYEGDKDVMNNIYDLEGNNAEWTAQAGNAGFRVLRGSTAYTVGPASYRSVSTPDVTSSFQASRLALYVV